ncbi:GNAT family N-acetyltransferase [Limnoraphis robusta]|jgi:putative acetyltransferase|uniref:Acetyltransferase n=2 Tax=Limnoraphis robusta TaxID=1118279 RepID=A0A0F5Y8X3_9CYAN|nr:GNAT family N-acetyltransferase [Limnoraphis robusta]KKD35324.1 acetyltransferase [Limnoraphis robusta CS-951]MEA5517818.1 GNAT family N-acetyltransferase [Limnoraphis robusta CCNP1315]MEA5546376.1 GNAT family N-acetyltransferase [Limnoraphis robusta CCNP1324]
MIRPYQEQDLNRLLEVWYSASKIAHSFLDEAFLETERQNIPKVYLPAAETWVFERDNLVLGFISLLDNQVGAIFVDPQFQRQGIGRALIDWAKTLRSQLFVEVFKENQAGRAFYQQYGFIPVDEHLHPETGYILLRLRLEY